MTIGDVPGINEGDVFEDRDALRRAGVHKASIAGIAANKKEGATSIVLNEGYVDDVDEGDIVIYTGAGGRDDKTGRQVKDQKFEGSNKHLVTSFQNSTPIRVSRGFKLKSKYAPEQGYRYDGLYFIESYWMEKGEDGFLICRYRLIKAQEFISNSNNVNSDHTRSPDRKIVTTTRIARDSQLALGVKELYDYKCQVCNTRLECVGGPYAEAAHIKPLGTGHDGPDIIENLLCLCPNHHKLFDGGGIIISDDFSVVGTDYKLTVKSNHDIRNEYISYHRGMWNK